MSFLTKRLQRGLQTAECLAGWAGTMVNTSILGTTAIGVSLLDPTSERVHPVAVAWARLGLRMVRSRTEVHGVDRLAPNQPYVVMANHQSHLDIWALFDTLPVQFRWVMKQELRKIPIFGLACERAGYIYVQRGNSESARTSMQLAADRIAAGATVVIFPEGTRTHDGKLLPFKSGGFRLALQAGVPILPVSIAGTSQMMPRGSWRYAPGLARVVIGDPIPTADRSLDDLTPLMDETRAAIELGLR